MKKTTKLLIGAAAAVGILGVVLAVVLAIPSQNHEIKVEDNNTILLYDKSSLIPDDIVVKNESGEYELMCFDYAQPVSKEESVSEAAPASDASDSSEESQTSEETTVILTYTMQDYDTEPLSRTMTDNLAQECRYMAATKLIDKSGSRYEEYGLDKPRAEAAVSFSDNSRVMLRLGKDAPDNMGVYLRINDDPNVYLVPSNMVDMFFVEKLQMFDKQLTGEMGDGTLKELEITGTGYPQKLLVTANDTKANAGLYVLKQPSRLSCQDSSVSLFAGSLFGLSATRVAAVAVTEKDYPAYGLDKPYQSMKLTLTDGKKVTLLASEKDKDGMCYLTSPTKTIIYQMSTEDLSWYGADADTFRTDGVLAVDSRYVDVMTITRKGIVDRYLFQREEKLSENYEDNIVTKVSHNGILLDMQNVLYFMTNTEGVTAKDEKPKSLDDCTLLMSIRFEYSDNSPYEDKLELYETADGRTVAVLNDSIEGYTDDAYVDELLEQAKQLASGLEVPLLAKEEQSSAKAS